MLPSEATPYHDGSNTIQHCLFNMVPLDGLPRAMPPILFAIWLKIINFDSTDQIKSFQWSAVQFQCFLANFNRALTFCTGNAGFWFLPLRYSQCRWALFWPSIYQQAYLLLWMRSLVSSACSYLYFLSWDVRLHPRKIFRWPLTCALETITRLFWTRMIIVWLILSSLDNIREKEPALVMTIILSSMCGDSFLHYFEELWNVITVTNNIFFIY